MKRMRKAERAARARFYIEGKALLASFGLHPREEYAPPKDNPYDMRPYACYAMDSAAGSAKLTLHDDWLHVAFADPAHAKRLVDCNPYSGKWNHHAFLSQHETDQLENTVTDVLRDIRLKLATIEAKPSDT